MAMSGIGCADEAVTRFEELKLGRGSSHSYIFFAIQGEEIAVEKLGETGASWESMVEQLPPTDCRYVVYDLHFVDEADAGRKIDKIVFLHWAPDESSIKSRMLYASSKDALKKKLSSLSVEFQATDMAEVELSELMARIKRV
eukprot:PLAT7383.1.p1 GENE.PLAT7383.1~~PLAT7383.1.p1  ORF type:complete len:142 (+),score=45.98 PLAT7383.1:208-633(+)